MGNDQAEVPSSGRVRFSRPNSAGVRTKEAPYMGTTALGLTKLFVLVRTNAEG